VAITAAAISALLVELLMSPPEISYLLSASALGSRGGDNDVAHSELPQDCYALSMPA